MRWSEAAGRHLRSSCGERQMGKHAHPRAFDSGLPVPILEVWMETGVTDAPMGDLYAWTWSV